MTRILGLETSCDETAAAIVEDGRIVHSAVVASQVDLDARYGFAPTLAETPAGLPAEPRISVRGKAG